MVTATSPTNLSPALRLTPRPYQYEAVAALLAATARGVQRRRGRAKPLCLPSWSSGAAAGP